MRGVVVVVTLVACGSPRKAPPDATRDDLDAALIDAAPDDADIDASPDAPPDAPPPASTCTATAMMLTDVSPRQISNLAASGTTLYVAAHEVDNQTAVNGAVIPIDTTTGQLGAPFAITGGATLSPGETGDVYAAEYVENGTIWKMQAAPTAVVTGRNRPSFVAADATHIYWTESTSPLTPDIVRRKAFASTAIEDVMTCDRPRRLLLDATNVYCGTFQYWYVAPKTGSTTPMSIPTTDGYPVGGAVRDGSTIYYVNWRPTPQLWRIPLPGGPAALVHESTQAGGWDGLALGSTYYYVMDTHSGLRRIHRTFKTPQVIYAAVGLGRDPVLVAGKLYFAAPNPQLSGLRYVMHCID